MVDVGAVGVGLEVLADVETEAGLAARRYRLTPYRVASSHAVRRRGALDFDDVPVRAPKQRAKRRHRSRATADVVVFGKFDRPGNTRLRAFYGRTDQGPVAVKVQPWQGERKHGIGREVAARRRVAELVPEIAPPLHAHGVLEAAEGTLGYMVEGLVDGRHPLRSEIHEMVGPLAEGLVRLYQAAGVTYEPFSAVASDQLMVSWKRLAEERDDAADLLPRVERLLAEDRTVAVSLAHGDPVASNVVVADGGRVVLVDWEYAREGPVAGDLAKPLQQAGDQEAALESIERRAGATLVEDGAYDLREQLALGQVRLLGWYESQRVKAEAAGRLPQLQKTLDQRLSMIRWLLG